MVTITLFKEHSVLLEPFKHPTEINLTNLSNKRTGIDEQPMDSDVHMANGRSQGNISPVWSRPVPGAINKETTALNVKVKPDGPVGHLNV